MDFNKIAIYELDYSLEIVNIYNSSCSEVTMYDYAALAETKKPSM